jgi:hypothetical protein
MTRKQWVNGDVLTAADQNALSDQTINRFADATARDASISSPSEGMFVYLTGTNALQYYDGSSWTATDLTSDITGITTAANSSMAGGATSGAPSLSVDVHNTTSTTAVATDYVLISDTGSSNVTRKALISDITALVPQGDLTGLTAGTNIDISNATGPVPTINVAIDAALDCADQLVTKPMLKDYSELTAANAASGTSATIDLENGNVHTVTMTGNCTFTFSNPIASDDCSSFTLILTQDGTGSRTATWPASVDWPGGTAPTLTTTATTGRDMLMFVTVDAGTTWLGSSLLDFS